jgi:LEA14-like dessication related protein
MLTLKQKLIGGGLILGLLLLGGYFARQFTILKNSCYAVVGVVLHELGLKKVRMTVLTKIQNKSDITINITQQKYDIYVNKLLAANFQTNKPIQLLANTETILPIEIEFNPTDLLQKGVKDIQNLLVDKSKLIITTKGVLTVGAGIVNIKNLPVETSMTLAEMMAPLPDADPCKKYK